MGFQPLAECWPRFSRRRINGWVVSDTWAKNWESTVGDSWQPDGRHYQTAIVPVWDWQSRDRQPGRSVMRLSRPRHHHHHHLKPVAAAVAIACQHARYSSVQLHGKINTLLF